MKNADTHACRVYFSVLPSKAGFTDQLFQFNTFYKFGLSLHYHYLHSPFANTRPGAEKVFEFLGFNAHFADRAVTPMAQRYLAMGTNNRLQPEGKTWYRRLIRKLRFHWYHWRYFKQDNFIDIGLGNDFNQCTQVQKIDCLKKLVQDIVDRKAAKNPSHRDIVRFFLAGGRSFFREIAPLINQEEPFFPDNLDLRSAYFADHCAMRCRFSQDRIKLLVHIRLGDTALIRTPWDSYIPLWSDQCLRPLKEYPDQSANLFKQVTDLEDFHRFLERLDDSLGREHFSGAIFSDGYKTAFKELFGRIDDLGLDAESIQRLKQSAPNYETERFSLFGDFDEFPRFVGETNEDLQELIHAALLADVIVVGSHQRMLPKFLTTYYSLSRALPPIIVALYKGRPARYALKIGLHERKAKVYPINVDNLDADEVLPILLGEVRRRFLPRTTAVTAGTDKLSRH